jgi:hypothetical protein
LQVANQSITKTSMRRRVTTKGTLPLELKGKPMVLERERTGDIREEAMGRNLMNTSKR